MRLADPAFRAIFEDSPIGICVVDRNIKVIDVNAAYCDMLGRTEAEVMGAHIPDFTHPDDRDRDAEALPRVLSGDIPQYKADKRYLRKDGAVIWARIVVTAVLDPSGKSQLAFSMAQVITEEVLPGVHVSGHPSQEELKLMLNLTRPRFLMPVHGEYRHLHLHAQLGQRVGIPSEQIFILDNGDVLEVRPNWAGVVGKVPAGRVFVDGKGVGDVGDTVLRDRQHLAQDGMVLVVIGFDKTGTVVAGPDILSRGFAHLPEDDALFEEARRLILTILEGCSVEEKTDWSLIKQRIRSVLRKFLQKTMERRPMILPVIIEI